jgi:DNA primase
MSLMANFGDIKNKSLRHEARNFIFQCICVFDRQFPSVRSRHPGVGNLYSMNYTYAMLQFPHMDQVAQVKEKIDIVSFIGEYISLKKAGRNFSANCPFHQEKTPSFMVSPERQTWHCFGCHKSGDVYAFLMEYDRMEFPEALRILAKRTGIQLKFDQGQSRLSTQKERMYLLNSLAKEFYHYILTKHAAGKDALNYLQKRGITAKLIETFSLGFSPSGSDALCKYLISKKKYVREELVLAGLAYEGRRETIDFFRGRLMFPLMDYRDNVLGFSARILAGGNVPSKYINTRETLVYHKSEHVYGLNVTKDAIRRENQVIIVEGEFDLLSCFEHGIGNVVAVKGTALTQQQVLLIGRYGEKITFCFDGDKAGQEAIRRSLSIVEKKGLSATVIVIPNGKDPDESLNKEPGLFKKAVKEDMGVYDYLFMRAYDSTDNKTAQGKQRITKDLLPFIGQIQNEIIKEHYLRKLSSDIGISYESIVKEMLRFLAPKNPDPVITPSKIKQSKEEITEQYLLALIVQSDNPSKYISDAMDVFSAVLPQESACQKNLFLLYTYCRRKTAFDNKSFGDSLDMPLQETYNIACLYPLPVFEDEKKLQFEVEKTSQSLRLIYVQNKMKQIASEIRERVHEGNGIEVEKLEKEYSSLVSQLE